MSEPKEWSFRWAWKKGNARGRCIALLIYPIIYFVITPIYYLMLWTTFPIWWLHEKLER